MKKSGNIFQYKQSTISPVLIGLVTGLLLILKIASPFLHLHTSVESAGSEIILCIHCDACEYEATQAIEPGTLVMLPINDFQYEAKVFEIQSPFISESYFTFNYRGPPKNS